MDDRRTSHVRRRVREADQQQPTAVSLSRRAGALLVRVLAVDQADGHRVRRTRRARMPNIAAFGDSTGTNAGGGTFLFDWGNTVVGATLRDVVPARRTAQWLFGDSATAEQHASRSRFSTALDLGAGSLIADEHGQRHASRGIDHGAQRVQRSHARLRRGDVHDRLWTRRRRRRRRNSTAYTSARHRARCSSTICGGRRPRGWSRPGCAVRRTPAADSRGSALSPRVSAKYFVTPELAVTAAVGKFTQGMHSLAREDIPVRLFDFWVASDSVTPVSSAWHYVTGAEKWFGTTRYVRVEGFYKKYGQPARGKSAADPDDRGDEFLLGERRVVRRRCAACGSSSAGRSADGSRTRTRSRRGRSTRSATSRDTTAVTISTSSRTGGAKKYLIGVALRLRDGHAVHRHRRRDRAAHLRSRAQRVRHARRRSAERIHRRPARRRAAAGDAATRPRA